METNKKTITKQQLLSLADKFSKIGAHTQSEYIVNIANNGPHGRASIVLEAFQSLYNYMSK